MAADAAPGAGGAVMTRLIVLTVSGAALLLAGIAQGAVIDLFATDLTGMTGGIGAAFLCGIVAAFLGRWGAVEWIAEHLPTLGLLGTVLGFAIALGGLTGDDLSIRNLGIHTALNTTIAGVIGSLWLSLTMRLCR